MLLIFVPIFHIGLSVFVKVSLIHPEGDGYIFWLPLLKIGIFVGHAQLFHHGPTSGIIHVVGSGDVRKSGIF